mmetsp:Transcript_512/g.482  ORF Transcript_512/g.482 Transcript_512/m.482 type:complete len:261 (+) Transcript_512:251-1033(+)
MHLLIHLLAHVWSNRSYITHNLFGILSNLIKVLIGNGHRIEKRSDKSHRSGTHFQKLSSIVKINSRGRINGEEGKGGTDSLYPSWSSSNTGEKLLEGCSVTVGGDEFGGCLTSGYRDDVTCGTPFNYIWEHNRGDNEFGSRINGLFSILNGENSSASHHNIPIISLSKVRKMIKTIRSSQSKLADLESSINGSLHGLGTGIGGGGTEHGTGTDLGELLEDRIIAFLGLHAVKTGEGTAGGDGGTDSGSEGLGGCGAKSHC